DDNDQLGMSLGIGFVAPRLEILLVAARLEHLDRELLVEIGHRASIHRGRARTLLRPAANLIDCADGEKPGEPDRANGHDPVGQANREAAHGGPRNVRNSRLPLKTQLRQSRRTSAAYFLGTGYHLDSILIL